MSWWCLCKRDVDSVINCGEAKEMWDLVMALFSVSRFFQDVCNCFGWLVRQQSRKMHEKGIASKWY